MARSKSFGAVLGAVGLGIGSLALVAATGGAGASVSAKAPTVTVKPTTDLKAVATVKVSGKNLGDNAELGILECWSGDTTEAGCNVAGVVVTSASSTGALAPTALKVHSSYASEGDGKVKCTTAEPCLVVVANAATSTEEGAVPISFAPKS
jgi:hypothetical protein